MACGESGESAFQEEGCVAPWGEGAGQNELLAAGMLFVCARLVLQVRRNEEGCPFSLREEHLAKATELQLGWFEAFFAQHVFDQGNAGVARLDRHARRGQGDAKRGEVAQ